MGSETAIRVEGAVAKPGDTLVIRFQQDVNPEVCREIADEVRKRLPDSVDVVALGGGIEEVLVIRGAGS